MSEQDPPFALERRDWIAGLEKGLAVIEAFDAEHPRLTASQAGQRCGLTRTAARRHLLTLVHLGYVATDGKLFSLTPRVLRLGQAYLESARLPRAVQPYLQRVTAGTGEVAYAGVLEQDELVYVARSGSHRQLNTGYMLGSRVQAQVTAAGLVILAMSGAEVYEPWLARQELRAYTSHTVVDRDELRRREVRSPAASPALDERTDPIFFPCEGGVRPQPGDRESRALKATAEDHRSPVQAGGFPFGCPHVQTE